MPKSLGNEALPRWLVRDFNPFAYRWTPAISISSRGRVDVVGGNRDGRGGPVEDPPWVLAELRGVYADILRGLKSKRREGRKIGGIESRDGYITCQSLLRLTLDEAVRDPRWRSAVLRRMLQKCSRQFETLDYDRIVDVLGSGSKLDMCTMKCLRMNIKELVK